MMTIVSFWRWTTLTDQKEMWSYLITDVFITVWRLLPEILSLCRYTICRRWDFLMHMHTQKAHKWVLLQVDGWCPASALFTGSCQDSIKLLSGQLTVIWQEYFWFLSCRYVRKSLMQFCDVTGHDRHFIINILAMTRAVNLSN